MNVAQLRAVAGYLPAGRLDNRTLVEAFPKWTEEKIVRKLGISARPIAGEGETALDLGVAAAERLFDSGVVKREEIDFLIFCTQSPDYFLPPSACVMQSRLGLPARCGAFDINLGCSGYVYGLSLCKGLVETGQARKILFVTGETYAKYINDKDSVSRPIFGDGGAASLVEASEGEYPSGDVFSGAPTFGEFEFGTDGSRADMLIVEAGASRVPHSAETCVPKIDHLGNTRSREQLFMDGPGVFTFSIDTVPPLVRRYRELAAKNGFEIDAYVLHQANKFMLDRLRDLCDVDESKFFNSILTRANTVSSTIPIALADAQRDGMIGPGSRVFLCGFGVGLSWSACLLRLPENFTSVPLED